MTGSTGTETKAAALEILHPLPEKADTYDTDDAVVSKKLGTQNDRLDMTRMGKSQQLRVRLIDSTGLAILKTN